MASTGLWVLEIMASLSGRPAIESIKEPYHSKESCKAAAAVVKEEFRNYDIAKPISFALTACIPVDGLVDAKTNR